MSTELPCTKNKCVLYPVCINKEYIDCEYLKEYFSQVRIHKISQRSLCETINEYLPNVKIVKLKSLSRSFYNRQRYRYYNAKKMSV